MILFHVVDNESFSNVEFKIECSIVQILFGSEEGYETKDKRFTEMGSKKSEVICP